MKVSSLSFVLIAAALVGCGDKREEPIAAKTPIAKTNPDEVVLAPDSPKLRGIKVEPVATAEAASDEVGSPGKVEVNPNRVAHVLLPLQGRIAKVFVKFGDAVRQGQTLMELESPDADVAMSTYLQAGAALTQARLVAAKSQADMDRTRDLFENNAVPKKDLLSAQTVSTQANAAIEQAEAALQQSQRRLEILGLKPGAFGQHVEVKAPVSGKVLEMTIVPGEYRNDTSSPVLTIADLSTVWVTSDVPESSIRMVRKGERLDIELAAYPGEVFHGRVAQIADTVDPETRTIKVRAEIQNLDGRLRPEMFARIRMISGTQQRPVIPVTAVRKGIQAPMSSAKSRPAAFGKLPSL